MSDINFISLVPLGITRGPGLQNTYIMILREVDGTRCMAILVSDEEYEMFTQTIQNRKLPLVKSIRHILDTFGMSLECVVIHSNTPKGEYCSELLIKQGGDVRTVRERVGVGVVLALQYMIPLQVSAQYFDMICGSTPDKSGNVQIVLPMAAMDEKLLREAIDKAVEEDNFELATHLRDEIARREAVSHTSTTAEF